MINKFSQWINEREIDGVEADKYAFSKGLDVKKKKEEKESELINGGPIESLLIDILHDLEQSTGLNLLITGGNDRFHREKIKYRSLHIEGRAIDIASRKLALDKNARLTLEKAILDIMISGKYNQGGYRLGAINEFERPTKSATGGHFHLSLYDDNPKLDHKECGLYLLGITSYAAVRKMIESGEKPEFDKIPKSTSSLTKDKIKEAQQSLLALGYQLPRYGADGIVGPETSAALKKFQDDQGITPSGILDEPTIAKLSKMETQPTSKKTPRRLKFMDRDKNRMLQLSIEQDGTITIYDKSMNPLGKITKTPDGKIMSNEGGTDLDITDTELGKSVEGLISQISDKFSARKTKSVADIEKITTSNAPTFSGQPVVPSSYSQKSSKGAAIAKKLMADLGLSKEQAAGVVGNLWAESGLVPDRIQGSGMKRGVLPQAGNGGYGWAQYTNPSYKTDLINFAKDRGIDLNTQPLTDELNYEYLKHWIVKNQSRFNALKSTKDLRGATDYFLKKYERPADQSEVALNKRAGFAELVYNSIT